MTIYLGVTPIVVKSELIRPPGLQCIELVSWDELDIDALPGRTPNNLGVHVICDYHALEKYDQKDTTELLFGLPESSFGR
jgi:hypothetical protein